MTRATRRHRSRPCRRSSSTVRRRAVAVGLALLAVAPLSGAAAVPGFGHGPYAGAPSVDEVTISWLVSPPLPARVEYGVEEDYRVTGVFGFALEVPAIEQDAFHKTTHATIGGLKPATDYVYRVVLRGEGEEAASPVGRFRTAPLAGTPVSFVVLADTQKQVEGASRLALVGDAIATDELSYDFILHAGDVVESPVDTYWDDWFVSFDHMLRRAPFLPVLGNHERNHRSYYDAFALPPGGGKDGKQWWALHWGDVVVCGLDTNVSRVADYYAQQDWARTHLAGPEEHKFVIFHHPVFSSDAYHGSGYSYDVIYHPIFVEHGVDIVFNGHAHNYERIERDGITYLVVGGGGATPREFAPEHVDGSVVATEGHYFYVRVSTSPGRIAVEVPSVAVEQGEPPTMTPGLLLDALELPAARGRLPLGLVALLVAGGAVLAALLLGLLRR